MDRLFYLRSIERNLVLSTGITANLHTIFLFRLTVYYHWGIPYVNHLIQPRMDIDMLQVPKYTGITVPFNRTLNLSGFRSKVSACADDHTAANAQNWKVTR
jgi:hypothetical protein